MRFALLLYLDPVVAATTTREEAEVELAAYAALTRDLEAAGVLRGGEALLPTGSAATVTVGDGAPVPADPPAAALELSGYYLVECDEEEALEIASRMPVAAHGAVEVRPVRPAPAAGPE